MRKTVIVTGASTGIGFETVRLLNQLEFDVIATVRKNEDLEKIKSEIGNNVKVLLMDVSDLKNIEGLPNRIQDEFGINRIYGIVNNAGVALAGPYKEQEFFEIEQMIKVNLIGLMKVTHVLLPFMENDGRIVNISSVAGKSALPFLVGYAATKFAVEGFSEGLRRELKGLGIKVSVVGPGSIKTPIWQKGLNQLKPQYQKSKLVNPFQKFIKIAAHEERNGLEPIEVSICIKHALTSKCPKFRYTPIPNKIRNWYLPRILPICFYDYLVSKTLKM